MFHCFNISKHISISLLFFITSVSCFVFFCWIFENNCPRGGVQDNFSAPGVGFCTFFVPKEWEIRPSKKLTRGLPRGEWSGLELTDT